LHARYSLIQVGLEADWLSTGRFTAATGTRSCHRSSRPYSSFLELVKHLDARRATSKQPDCSNYAAGRPLWGLRPDPLLQSKCPSPVAARRACTLNAHKEIKASSSFCSVNSILKLLGYLDVLGGGA